MLLAVYGTLRRGFKAHALLKNAKLLWSGFVKMPFRMIVHNCIPFLMPCETPKDIYVEVYEVSKHVLEAIDRYEGVPILYRRIEVEIPRLGKAFIYVASGPIEGEIVDDGDFLRYACRKCPDVLEIPELCLDIP